jgi:hypothetical protein
MYPFATQQEARLFARMVAEEMLILQQPNAKHITFADAMKELGIKNDALTNRIKATGIPTYRYGRGKAFDRKYLPRLR